MVSSGDSPVTTLIIVIDFIQTWRMEFTDDRSGVFLKSQSILPTRQHFLRTGAQIEMSSETKAQPKS